MLASRRSPGALVLSAIGGDGADSRSCRLVTLQQVIEDTKASIAQLKKKMDAPLDDPEGLFSLVRRPLVSSWTLADARCRSEKRTRSLIAWTTWRLFSEMACSTWRKVRSFAPKSCSQC